MSLILQIVVETNSFHPEAWGEIVHSISDLAAAEPRAGAKILAKAVPSHMQEKRIQGILIFATALLPHLTLCGWNPTAIIRTTLHRCSLFSLKKWRGFRALPSFPLTHLPFWCQLPFRGGLQRIVCAGSGPAFPFSLCATPSFELYHLIPSSWLCCCNKWELFLNVAQRCL